MVQLDKVAKRKRIALVGHEPDLGQLAAFLLGGKRPLPFRKGGICRIDVQGLSSTRAGSLIWFIPPRVLRKLAD
jgi:phosphohistidine phosphatase SixA